MEKMGRTVRACALRSYWADKNKKRLGELNGSSGLWAGQALRDLFAFLLKEHDSLELQNCVSVYHYLHAVKGGIPTMKVTINTHKRRLTNNQCAKDPSYILWSCTDHPLFNAPVQRAQEKRTEISVTTLVWNSNILNLNKINRLKLKIKDPRNLVLISNH